MKKAWLIVGAIAIVVVGGVVVWMVLGAKPQSSSDSTRIGDAPSNASDVTDLTAQTGSVTVEMKNTAFTPQKIKIKKDTTVRWVNQDTVRHNVVAAGANDTRALPTENALLGKGESYSLIFDIIGTYNYTCTPHPFMTGSIEVVD